MNTDYKVFAKIMADRLKLYLINHINEDQAGFLPGRQIKDNLRILLNMIEYYDKRINKEVAFFSSTQKKRLIMLIGIYKNY